MFDEVKQAFYYGRTSIARILLNKKADLQAKDIYGATPCHLAIDTNQYDVLKIALENQANVNVADDSGWTLLMRAGKLLSLLIFPFRS